MTAVAIDVYWLLQYRNCVPVLEIFQAIYDIVFSGCMITRVKTLMRYPIFPVCI